MNARRSVRNRPSALTGYGPTTVRILRQLRSDHRTLGMILVVPTLLVTLLYFLYQNEPTPPFGPSLFDRVAITMLGVLPFAVLFLVTSIAMQRERSTGTLERLLSTPIGKPALLFGYGTAFGLLAAASSAIAATVAIGPLGVDVAGSAGVVVVVAVASGLLGVGLGLLASAFARTEFQAVQFMPIVVVPQLFLCGLLVPRDQLPSWLEAISNVLPLSYAVDALKLVLTEPAVGERGVWDIAVVLGCAAVALLLAAATLRRRTP